MKISAFLFILLFPFSSLYASQDLQHRSGNLSTSESPQAPLEDLFISPHQNHKPILIWQWMDGLVTKEGITRDLEAFKEAGLGGVQNFQIGGPLQIRIGNPDNAIGSPRWKELLKWTLDECERLGLTFGTHNSPGWSSSAHPGVLPQYSMLKLVYSEVSCPLGERIIILPRPDVDPIFDYYDDVAVMAVPRDSTALKSEIVDLTKYFDPTSGALSLPEASLPPGEMSILRIGQTTNGQTNWAQAPESGCGLECDKLSKEGARHFWNLYPAMVIETAGRHAGHTFTHFEIDSYEAGGQYWSPVLPAEFKSRRGYDLMPWLPYMVGRILTIGSKEESDKFYHDWRATVTDCVAENYFGELTRLARESGVGMIIEPYGTSHQLPFVIIDFRKIANACPGAVISTEFWQAPDWGWKDMGRHEQLARSLQLPVLMAESFTEWPMKAWSDSPASLKPRGDLAYCTGVNAMMLHAGAVNPWPGVEPGMSFGTWGTHFVPGQTWWKAGGAKALFAYMARCHALLQFGLPAATQIETLPPFRTYRRTDPSSDTDIIFICNPTDSCARGKVDFDVAGRTAEIWNPYDGSMYSLPGGNLDIGIEALGSRFIVIRPGKSNKSPEPAYALKKSWAPLLKWKISFPDGNSDTVTADTLFSWPESDNPDIKYFSGTASYATVLSLAKSDLPRKGERMVISLGDVKDMAALKVNGKVMPLMWKPPYECDITEAVSKGDNVIEIEVTNLWPNRMIGDELEPDDLQWSEPLVFDSAPGKPQAGRFLTSNPEWLVNGTQRPSSGRKTVGCFKFFKPDSPLLPSGLLGPVEVKVLHARPD